MGRPQSPTLSSLPAEGDSSGGGSVPKLVFSIEKAIETLARTIPGASEEAEQIKGLLRGILMKATQKGGSSRPMEGGRGAPISNGAKDLAY